jgi:hypothetical protein
MTELFIEDDYDVKEIEDFNLPLNTSIILCLDLKDKNFPKKLLKSLKDGFKYPVIDQNNLYLYHKFDPNFGRKVITKEWKKILKIVKFSITNYIAIKSQPTKNCDLFISIDPETLKYLKNYTQKYKFNFGKNTEQREISGVFSLSPLSKQNFLVSVIENRTSMGEKEESSNEDTIGSFHTHPLEAYIKYNVCGAWPSDDDYKTFLNVYYNGYGFFHIVSCLEGIYIITISDELMKVPRETIQKEYKKYEESIEKYYDHEYPTCTNKKKNSEDFREHFKMDDIKSYVKKINTQPYFVLQFFEWKDANKLIKIHYKEDDGNCFVQDEQINFKKLIKNVKK